MKGAERMKIGVIADIHSNLAALMTVDTYFRQEGCSAVICCGDVIGIGPDPEESVHYLMQTPGLFAVQGNHERYLAEGFPAGMPSSEMAHHAWQHSMLSETSKAFLASLPLYRSITLENRRITIAHYCMDAQQQYRPILPNPESGTLSALFPEGDIVLYGHDHHSRVCRAGARCFINAGSAGCPAKSGSVAHAGLLTLTESAVHFQPLSLNYDADRVLERIDRLNYPDAPLIKRVFYGVQP